MHSNWSYSPETAKLDVDLCDLDLWPWPFAWTSLLTMVITPENFMMIRWWEHGEKGVTDRRTDRRTDGRTENTICRAAWSQLTTMTPSKLHIPGPFLVDTPCKQTVIWKVSTSWRHQRHPIPQMFLYRQLDLCPSTMIPFHGVINSTSMAHLQWWTSQEYGQDQIDPP